MPKLPKGKVTVEITVPFTLRGRTEWVYVLGDFGVRAEGRRVIACPRKQTLDFGDIVPQTLPFYTGNITYHTTYVETEGVRGEKQIRIGGALARVTVDGRDAGVIAISPYCADLGFLDKGEHKIDITLFGTRYNGFGPVHNAHKKVNPIGGGWLTNGPGGWRTYDCPAWNDAYQLISAGILSCPTVY